MRDPCENLHGRVLRDTLPWAATLTRGVPARGSSNGRAPAQRSAGLEILTDGATDRFGDTDVLFGGP